MHFLLVEIHERNATKQLMIPPKVVLSIHDDKQTTLQSTTEKNVTVNVIKVTFFCFYVVKL